MEQKVIEIISAISKLPIDKLVSNKDTEKLWESITHVEIVIALEEEFDISFEQEEIAQMTSVSKIIELVGNKV